MEQPKPFRYPLLLVHGLGGFDQIRVDLVKKLAVRIDYFRGVRELYRHHGVGEVYSAQLPPSGSIRQRALVLRDFIQDQVRENRIHLVAHSMGGLDSRDYISHLGGDRRVCSLTTLGTPHRGSPIANLTLDALINPFAVLIRQFNMRDLVARLHARTAAHRDLRPEACAEFNARTPDAPEVRYFSYAGNPPASAVHLILRPTHQILLRRGDGGANDGLVTVSSARWTGFRGQVPADHLSLVGWQFLDSPRRHFDPEAFYLDLLEDLRSAETGAT